ncbi:hypothetical protein LCGC14_2223950 [marine sediment metagenome]|uniref:Uncharacterized protein n=1 Tax=marine sediment metagenome TaxID=412755 RepID=A0A0F9DXM4_9ZZZZ
MANEIIVEQILMERYRQPGGTEVKLCLLEIPEGFVGHPYTVERQVDGHWQHRTFGVTYGAARRLFREHRDLEGHIGSTRTLMGNYGS